MERVYRYFSIFVFLVFFAGLVSATSSSFGVESQSEWNKGSFSDTAVEKDSIGLEPVSPNRDWVIVHPDSTKALHYFPSNEDGTFGTPTQFGGSYHGEDDGGVVAGQFSGGDNWDLVSFDTTSDKWYLWEDIGSSPPSSPTCTIYSGSYSNKAQGVDTGDIDNDGDADIVSLDHGIWLENTGSCDWNQHSLDVSGHRDVVLDDFDGDGCEDIVYEDGNNNIDFASGNCDGSFGSPSQITDKGTWLGRGDFDEDGDLDLIINYDENGKMYIYLGNGNGGFSSAGSWDSSYRHGNPSVYDFDRDGYEDVIIGEHGDGDVNYWAGKEQENFTINPNGKLASFDGTLGVASPQDPFNGLGFDSSGVYTSKVFDPGVSEPQQIEEFTARTVIEGSESIRVRIGADTDDDGSIEEWSHSAGNGIQLGDGKNSLDNTDFSLPDAYRYQVEFSLENTDTDTRHRPVISSFRLEVREPGLHTISKDSEPGSDNAFLEGELVDAAGSSSVDVKFQYRKNTSSVWKNTSVQTLSSPGEFNTTISGLSSGVVYEWRSWADNGSTVEKGNVKEFRSWWNNSWDYRKEVNITEKAGNNLFDHQIRVNLDTSTLIDQGRMDSDCSDMRWVGSDGDKILNYWIESGCDTNSTSVWVTVPSIPSSSQKIIYMYYGNSGVSNASVAEPTEFMVAHGDDKNFKYYDLRENDTFGSGNLFGDGYAGEDDGGIVVSRFSGGRGRDMVSFDAKRDRWYLWEDIGDSAPNAPTCTLYSSTYAEKAQGVDAGDIDSDGDMDVVSNEHGVWLENTGSCDWKQHGLPNDEYRDIVVDDFNNDSCSDIVYDYNAQRVDIRSGNCDGTFSSANTVYNGSGDFWLGRGDLNGDGARDLIVNDQQAGFVYIFEGFGNGSFEMVNNISDEEYDHVNPATYDVNDDGNLDWVGGEHRDDQIHYFEGYGNFSFSKSTVENSYYKPLGITVFQDPEVSQPEVSFTSLSKSSICDRRGNENECIVENSKDISSESFILDKTFITKESSSFDALNGVADISVSNETFLSGIWRGSFTITGEKVTVRSGASFNPEGQIKILEN